MYSPRRFQFQCTFCIIFVIETHRTGLTLIKVAWIWNMKIRGIYLISDTWLNVSFRFVYFGSYYTANNPKLRSLAEWHRFSKNTITLFQPKHVSFNSNKPLFVTVTSWHLSYRSICVLRPDRRRSFSSNDITCINKIWKVIQGNGLPGIDPGCVWAELKIQSIDN